MNRDYIKEAMEALDDVYVPTTKRMVCMTEDMMKTWSMIYNDGVPLECVEGQDNIYKVGDWS